MSDRIYVTYAPTIAPESYHAAIHYERTNASGTVTQHVVIEASFQKFDQLNSADKILGAIEEHFREDNSASRFGNIDATVRDPKPADQTYAYEIIAEGADLSTNLAKIQLYAVGVNSAGFAYRGEHQNSNTFVSGALQAGELRAATGVAHDPAGPAGELLGFFVPGLNEPLKAPIGQTSSYEPVNGVQYSSLTNGDGSTTYTGEAGSSYGGATAKVNLHANSENIVDQIVTEDKDGTKTSETRDIGDHEAWLAQTTQFDAQNRTKAVDTLNDNGTSTLKKFDPNNTHPYNELDIDEDAAGKPTAVQMKIDGQNVTAAAASVGQVLGSALGRALAPNNQFGQIAIGTVAGAIGQQLAQAFAASLQTNAATFNLAGAFSDFHISIAGAGAGAVASFLTAELGHALGLSGFQEQLFNATIGTLANGVANRIASDLAHLTFDSAIGAIDWGSAVNGALAGAAGNIEPNIAAVLGAYLGHELEPAQTHEGAVGGQLLGAVGSAIGIALGTGLGAVLNFIIPGIGSLIGTIVGTLIGDAIGSHPHPAAVDLIDQAGDHYRYIHSAVAEGGTYDAPDKMAAATVDIINAYLHAVHGIVLDHSKQTMVGYVTDPDFRYINGWVPSHTYLSFISPYDAVHAAALDVLQNVEMIGGDLLLKRAHQNSPSNIADPGPEWSGLTAASSQSGAEKLATLSADLSVAQDYENYLNNREAINALMAANPDSAFTAGWHRARRPYMAGRYNRSHEWRILRNPGMAWPLTRCA